MGDVKTAFFRCDASSQVGIGHFMRCMTLAKALHNNGWQTAFLMDLATDYDFSNSDQSKFKILPENAFPDQCDLMVIDHYGLDQDYHAMCRKWAKQIMVIDDLANRQYDCDILLDQTYGRSASDYKSLTLDYCEILCGHDYILLKDAFLSLREVAIKKRHSTERVQNILINFGSTNPNGIIQTTLTALSKFVDWPLTINVVCSTIAEELDAVSELISEMNEAGDHKVTLKLDVTNMEEFMMDADLAIGAGGTTSWERACLGLPTLLIEVSQDQTLVSKNLQKQGAIKYLGELNSITGHDIDKAFESVRDNGEFLRQMSEKAFKICDGQGVSRVISVIDSVIEK